MSADAIVVRGLGKEYAIGGPEPGDGNFREAVVNVLAAPFKRLRRLAVREKDAPKRIWALKDVSFNVRSGEVVGIIGRNGAGKSTLLKILSRITTPTEGQARITGRVASLLEVGTGFHPELTGRENIYLNAAILGMARREIDRKFDEIVAFAEVERFLDTPVKRYSSGMSVRLAFAVAAHIEPEILIVDEVLAVGDVAFQEKCIGKMNSVAHSEGRTVLFVSHNMAAVQQLCERAILLDNGKVAAEGPPAEVVRAYMARMRTPHAVSLRDWRDRISTGEGCIADFTISDGAGAVTDTLPFGATVRFTLTMTFRDALARPRFGVRVHAADGESLLDLRSVHDGFRLERAEGQVVIEAVVSGLGLYPGEYTLTPWVSDQWHLVDSLQHCRRLHIVPAPTQHGDPKLFSHRGKYFVPSAWRLCAAETVEERPEPARAGANG